MPFCENVFNGNVVVLKYLISQNGPDFVTILMKWTIVLITKNRAKS